MKGHSPGAGSFSLLCWAGTVKSVSSSNLHLKVSYYVKFNLPVVPSSNMCCACPWTAQKGVKHILHFFCLLHSSESVLQQTFLKYSPFVMSQRAQFSDNTACQAFVWDWLITVLYRCHEEGTAKHHFSQEAVNRGLILQFSWERYSSRPVMPLYCLPIYFLHLTWHSAIEQKNRGLSPKQNSGKPTRVISSKKESSCHVEEEESTSCT